MPQNTYHVTTSDTKVKTISANELDMSVSGDFIHFLNDDGTVVFRVRRSFVVSIELEVDTETETEKADIRRVLRALNAVVDEAGADFVYQRVVAPNNFPNLITTSYSSPDTVCVYVRDGKPDCIAAKVLYRLGVVTIDQLTANENKSCDRIQGTGLHKSALTVLRMAQTAQDSGRTWGQARDGAFANARDYYGVTLN